MKIDPHHRAIANPPTIIAHPHGARAMPAAAIHIVPDDDFDDWVARDDNGREFGHYPTREEAELAAQPIARQLQTRLVVHLPDGKISCTNFTKTWIARLFGT